MPGEGRVSHCHTVSYSGVWSAVSGQMGSLWCHFLLANMRVQPASRPGSPVNTTLNSPGYCRDLAGPNIPDQGEDWDRPTCYLIITPVKIRRLIAGWHWPRSLSQSSWLLLFSPVTSLATIALLWTAFYLQHIGNNINSRTLVCLYIKLMSTYITRSKIPSSLPLCNPILNINYPKTLEDITN